MRIVHRALCIVHRSPHFSVVSLLPLTPFPVIMSESEDLAAQMREKIRNQASQVLDKVDETERRRSAESSTADLKALDSKTPDDKEKKEEEKVKLERKEDSEELTKRLQKLALEHQKQNAGDRLKVIQSDAASHLSSVKTFQELDLPKHLLEAIFLMGFDRPSAIQEAALPRILADPPRNLIGQAQSGSGKTAAFTLGMLYRVTVDEPATTQALCVTPTRELAIQIVDKAVRPMAAKMTGLKIQLAVAGTMIEKGKKVDAHLIVGTPGKVVEWIKRRTLDTRTIKVFVLDEADSMVDESGHRVNSILIKKQMPRTCQSLFFSATFPPDVVTFATKMVEKPDKILIEDGPEFLVRQMSRLPSLGHFCSVSYRFVGSRCHQAALDRHTPVRRGKAHVPRGYLLAVDHRSEYHLCRYQEGGR